MHLLTSIFVPSILSIYLLISSPESVDATQASSDQQQIDWASIPTPPRFVHAPNDPIAYFVIDHRKMVNGGGTVSLARLRHSADGHRPRKQQQPRRYSPATISGEQYAVGGEHREEEEQPLPPVNKPRTLRCAAVGVPRPEYKWLKDNATLPLEVYASRILTNPDNGSLTFVHFEDIDEGDYQCLAFNGNGTAYSEKMRLQQAWIRAFPVGKGPEIVTIPMGRPYTRDCVPPESSPPASTFWLFQSPGNERQIQGINVSHISTNDRGTIFFHHVKETDFKASTLYTCAAYNNELKEYKFSDNAFNFEVTKRHDRNLHTVPPEQQWVNQSSPIALLGHVHKLHCFFSGLPNPEPTWYHNGQAIRANNPKGFTFENHGKTLVFNVTAEHIGRYDCKFEKHPSSYDRSFDIKVNAAPYWHDQPPPNVNTSEGETVTFDCKSSGNPTPTITFYKNGVEMRRPRPGENWVIDGSKLTIFDVKQGAGGAGDNAVYQCKVENKHGYLWTNFYLNLLAFQPKLMEEPGQVEAIQGRPFSLSCKFFASPLAKVTWESPVLRGADFSQRVDQFGTGWLVFENVLPSYEGEYKCTGTNKYGSASGNIRLVVRKPTRLDQFTEQRMERRAGLPIRLECLAEHDLDLDIKYVWTINGKKLDQIGAESDHFRVLDDNTLEVDQPNQEDSGVYTCLASTKLDDASKSVTVVIEDVPPPVSSARILECNQTDPLVTITFDHLEPEDRTKPVEEFWLRYTVDQDVDQGKWHVYPVPVKAFQHEVIGDSLRQVNGRLSIMLKPFGTYAFQLIARNAIGDSAAYNIEGVCQTAQQAPSRNPSGVRVIGTQPDNLIIYWDPMGREEWNGEKFAYKIFYRRKDEDGGWKEVVVEDPFADQFTIDLGDNARAWDAYEVQVRAMNGRGLSKISPEVVEGRTGEGDPGVTPTNFRLKEVTATTAEFEWDPVDPSRVQGNFSGYKITYWYDVEATGEQQQQFSDDENNNSNRNAGAEHQQQQQLIKQAAAVARLKRKSSAATAQQQIWHDGIVRRRRQQRALTTSGGLSRKSMIFSTNVMRGTVVGLKPNTINFAVISVLNGQNEGTPSQELSFRTKEGVPTAVRDLHAYPMNFLMPSDRAVVMLKWHSPRTVNGRLTKYSVRHCRAEPGASDDEIDELTQCTTPLFVLPPDNELRIVRLDFDTNYRFIVVAHTAAGDGLPNSVDARTLPEMMRLSAEPSRPQLVKEGIGEDHFNITFVPGAFNEASGAPVGNAFLVRYREADDETAPWQEKHPVDKSTLQLTVDGLTQGTKYDVKVVAVQRDEAGSTLSSTESRVHHITTSGVSPRRATLYWVLAVLLILLLLLFCVCVACCLVYQRGRKYPVAEKERLHGREPMLPKERQFEEFGKGEETNRSLSGHVWGGGGESESDSLTEFGTDNDRGYNEDGSFVHMYGPGSKNAGLATTSQPTAESSSAGAQQPQQR
ncbi:hypothetical protein niasHT_037287 [Heterodera trifolii]|uniref:Neuroglian n=1 Tax=Heterodera trifolii TaxID=157864 RepID=A0ABD2J1Y7_9BILA